jgi:hypothetical protein
VNTTSKSQDARLTLPESGNCSVLIMADKSMTPLSTNTGARRAVLFQLVLTILKPLDLPHHVHSLSKGTEAKTIGMSLRVLLAGLSDLVVCQHR